METIEVPVKAVELEVEKGQGSVRFTIGPMAEKQCGLWPPWGPWAS